jgi:hypothetical protein
VDGSEGKRGGMVAKRTKTPRLMRRRRKRRGSKTKLKIKRMTSTA